jgi:cytochrome b561
MRAAEPDHYSSLQKTLHWLIATLIVVMIAVGITMRNIGEGPVTNFLYELHKSTGLTILGLALLRIVVRLRRGAPPLEPGIPPMQRLAAYASHYGLYALVLVTPIVGWTATSACCAPVNFFWTVPVTLPVSGEEAWWKAVFRIHFVLAFSLAALALLHASAALHHHFVRRDRTLRRMLPEREA